MSGEWPFREVSVVDAPRWRIDSEKARCGRAAGCRRRVRDLSIPRGHPVPPGQWHRLPPSGPRWGNVPSKSSTCWAAWLSYKAASISVPDPQQQPVSPSPPPERARRCTPTARAGRVTPGLDHTGLNRPTPPLRHTDLPMRPRRGSAGCSTRGRRASVAPRESGLYPDSRPAWHLNLDRFTEGACRLSLVQPDLIGAVRR
jgi:hypothetical protein